MYAIVQGARAHMLRKWLGWTGCRPSELLETTPARVDLSGGSIAIRSLKKRKDALGTSEDDLLQRAGDGGVP